MRMMNFARRNFLELIRDPLSLIFEIILPLFLLFIFRQFNIPSDVYRLENFTPAIVVFGFSFITLFTSSLIAKDRTSSLLTRLGASPMKASDFILGYVVSLIPIILVQNILFFVAACLMGLEFSINMIFTLFVSMIVSILFIALGILIGSLVSKKGTGELGSIIVQLVCFTSGMYFPKEMIGNVFARICEVLPFESCLNIVKAVFNSDASIVSLRNYVTFAVYTAVVILISVIVFRKNMISDNK